MQPQHYYVALEAKDPEQKLVVRIALSYEQAAKMMLYNGEVECTLEQYRDTTGKLVSEKVEPPKTVHQRMKERLTETNEDLLKRVEDIRRDLYEMVNGDVKRNKGKIEELLDSIKVVQSHLKSNQSFVVQQAEEELQSMQNNAAGQLGLYIQTKLGVEAPVDAIKQLIPISDGPLLLGEPITPVKDDYELKPREILPGETCQDYINRIEREDPKLAIIVLQSSYMMVHKKLPTKSELFEVWIQENCDSDELQTEYGNYRLELIQKGFDDKSFRNWAQTKFSELLETYKIDLESLDIDRLLDGKR